MVFQYFKVHKQPKNLSIVISSLLLNQPFDVTNLADANLTNVKIFTVYTKAYTENSGVAKFKELILSERQPENSWVGNLDFDDEGEPIGHYELDYEDNNTCKSEVWWRIEDQWDSRYYVYIDLLVLEVQ